MFLNKRTFFWACEEVNVLLKTISIIDFQLLVKKIKERSVKNFLRKTPEKKCKKVFRWKKIPLLALGNQSSDSTFDPTTGSQQTYIPIFNPL